MQVHLPDARIVLHRLALAAGDDVPLVEHRHLVADFAYECQIVLDDQQGAVRRQHTQQVAGDPALLGAHAGCGLITFEAKAFGVLNAGFMDRAMLDHLLQRADADAAEVLEKTPRAATQFLDPTGNTIGDTLHQEEGLAYATFDLDEFVEPKQFHDIVGYYNRFDIFELNIDRRRLAPVRFIDNAGAGAGLNGTEGAERASETVVR